MTETKRVLRPKAAARRAYDRMSIVYDWLTASETALRDELVGLAAVLPGERVLEVGPGTGVILADLATHAGVEGEIWGLDLSPDMLARARRRATDGRSSAPIRWVRADGAALPVAPGSYDAVLMSFTLELFDTPEIPRVLAECRRVLRPSGRLVVGCLASRPDRRWPVIAYEWLHVQFPEWLDCRPIPVRVLLAESGFLSFKVLERSLWGLAVDLVAARPAPG